MCDNIVTGCQLPATLLWNAHLKPSHDKPVLTASLSRTYSKSSTLTKSNFVTWAKTAMIATTSKAATKICGRTDHGFRCGGMAADGLGDDVWTADGMDRVNCPHILEFL